VSNDKNVPTDPDACYEAVASQEEIYLEESEEEVCAVLLAGDPAPPDATDEQLDCATEELITGDPDDPPLGDEVVAEMLDDSHPQRRKALDRPPLG